MNIRRFQITSIEINNDSVIINDDNIYERKDFCLMSQSPDVNAEVISSLASFVAGAVLIMVIGICFFCYCRRDDDASIFFFKHAFPKYNVRRRQRNDGGILLSDLTSNSGS